jgi:hypothetical protein
MNLQSLLSSIDANTARAFVSAARHVIDALLVEAERIEQMNPPQPRDYTSATLQNDSPAGGWLSHSELRSAAQNLAEAVAAEKWTDGVIAAVRTLALFGALP